MLPFLETQTRGLPSLTYPQARCCMLRQGNDVSVAANVHTEAFRRHPQEELEEDYLPIPHYVQFQHRGQFSHDCPLMIRRQDSGKETAGAQAEGSLLDTL